MKQTLVKNSRKEGVRWRKQQALGEPGLRWHRLRRGFMKALRSVIPTLGMLLVVSGAHAQSDTVSVRVPFDFIVGKQVYSAGNYLFSSQARSIQAVFIRSTDDRKVGLVLTQNCQKFNPAAKTMLTFDRYGDQYFLKQIWMQGNTRGREFPKSPIEKKLLALNRQEHDEVIVAGLVIY